MRGAVAVVAALLLPAAAQRASGASVSLQAMSTTVAHQGDVGRVCVVLTTNGNPVAGTQNRLRWDGNCATGPDPPRCYPAGSHGKQVQTPPDLRSQPEFAVMVLVLSLSDVEPMADGPLYCCDLQGEADPGQCCPVSLTDTGASTPDGNAIPTTGNTAQICTAAGSDQPARPVGSGGGGQSMSTSNAPPPPSDVGGGASAPPAPPPGGGPPASQVLQGGGARVETPPGAAAGPPTVPALQLPTPPAAQAPAVAQAPAIAQAPAPGPGGGSAVQPALPPATAAPTSAPTQAPTAPAAKDTPAAPPTVAPTAVPTNAAPTPKQQQAEPQAQSAKGGGWFGCQISAAASAGPVLGLGLLALLGAVVRRRRGARRRPYR